MSEALALAAPILAFAVAAAAPGPATLAVTATAMASGRRAALALGMGLALGLALWGLAVALGLGALTLHWAPALTLLKWAGGLYLLYLAMRAAKAALTPGSSPTGTAVGRRAFVRGLALNALNPKAALAWGAVIALATDTPASWTMVATVLCCALLGVGIYAGYALAFSTPTPRRWYARQRRRIEAVVALVFGAAGVRLLLWRPETP
ncbi:MAG: LysE family transporter [Pseudomonadota bacterium]